MLNRSLAARGLAALFLVGALGGCATMSDGSDPHDPWEPMNRAFYDLNDSLDRFFLAPIAELYLELPGGLRNSVSNFFANAEYPGTAINQLLQGKFELAMEDSARFIFNSTFGLGGLLDLSTGFGFEEHDEDFGQTLAVWGVGEGNYINYPFLGPSTMRDTPAIVVGAFTDILTYVGLFPLGLVETVDRRANLSSALKVRDESALDPYVYTREAFRQRREYLIHDGNPPLEELDDPEPARN